VCRMKPVTVTTTIDRPRDDVYAVLEDLMNHEAFTDHFLTDYQRTASGIRVKGKTGGGWMEITHRRSPRRAAHPLLPAQAERPRPRAAQAAAGGTLSASSAARIRSGISAGRRVSRSTNTWTNHPVAAGSPPPSPNSAIS
jgi:hypothetical protein